MAHSNEQEDADIDAPGGLTHKQLRRNLRWLAEKSLDYKNISQRVVHIFANITRAYHQGNGENVAAAYSLLDLSRHGNYSATNSKDWFACYDLEDVTIRELRDLHELGCIIYKDIYDEVNRVLYGTSLSHKALRRNLRYLAEEMRKRRA